MAEVLQSLKSLFGVEYGTLSRAQNKDNFTRWDAKVIFFKSSESKRIHFDQLAELLDQRPRSEIAREFGESETTAKGLTGEFVTSGTNDYWMILLESKYLLRKNKKGDLKLVPKSLMF